MTVLTCRGRQIQAHLCKVQPSRYTADPSNQTERLDQNYEQDWKILPKRETYERIEGNNILTILKPGEGPYLWQEFTGSFITLKFFIAQISCRQWQCTEFFLGDNRGRRAPLSVVSVPTKQKDQCKKFCFQNFLGVTNLAAPSSTDMDNILIHIFVLTAWN